MMMAASLLLGPPQARSLALWEEAAWKLLGAVELVMMVLLLAMLPCTGLLGQKQPEQQKPGQEKRRQQQVGQKRQPGQQQQHLGYQG